VADKNSTVAWVKTIFPPKALTFAEAKDQVLPAYVKDYKATKRKEWVTKLRSTYEVKVFPETIAKAEKYLDSQMSKAADNWNDKKPHPSFKAH